MWLVVCMITATLLRLHLAAPRRRRARSPPCSPTTAASRAWAAARRCGSTRRPPAALRIAHLSDLHVNEGDTRAHGRARRARRQPPARPRARRAAARRRRRHPRHRRRHRSRHRRRPGATSSTPSTSAGSPTRMILVPGNHDIAFVDHIVRKRALRPIASASCSSANLLKFCEAFAETCGGQRGFVLVDGQPRSLPRRLGATAEQAVRPLVAALPTTPVPPLTPAPLVAASATRSSTTWSKIEAARERLLALFPVAVPLAATRTRSCSCSTRCASVSRHPAHQRASGTSAARSTGGSIGWRASSRAAAQAGRACTTTSCAAARSSRPRFMTRVFAKFTVLGDSRPLVRFCTPLGRARGAQRPPPPVVSAAPADRARCCSPRPRRRSATSWRTIRARSSSATTSRREPDADVGRHLPRARFACRAIRRRRRRRSAPPPTSPPS